MNSKPAEEENILAIMCFQNSMAFNGLLRGIVVGLLFSSIIAFIGVGNSENEVANDNSLILDTSSSAENLADYLHREVRVLCFVVPIGKSTLEERGQYILDTWGKRCQHFIFFADDPALGFSEDNVVVLYDKRNNWAKLREALAYIYKHHMSDFDWILKVTDTTYVVMENLRWLLYQYDSNLPVFVGQRYLKDYMFGVYALSKFGFIRLIENGFTNSEVCVEDGIDADKEISACLQMINVFQIDGIDDSGKGMFFDRVPEPILFPEVYDKDFGRLYFHKLKQGIDACCSDRLIAIQNTRKLGFFYYEYYIYKVHAFGRHRLPEKLPQKKTLHEIVKMY